MSAGALQGRSRPVPLPDRARPPARRAGTHAGRWQRARAPLDEAAMPGLLAQLDALGAESVAICLLHAYANAAHEQRLKALIAGGAAGAAGVAQQRDQPGDPRIRAQQHHGAERAADAGGEGLSRPAGSAPGGGRLPPAGLPGAVERRRLQPAARGGAAGAAAALRSLGRRAGGGAHRAAAGAAEPRRGRHGRHQLRRLRGAGRPRRSS